MDYKVDRNGHQSQVQLKIRGHLLDLETSPPMSTHDGPKGCLRWTSRSSDTRQGNGVRWDRLDEIEGAEVYF